MMQYKKYSIVLLLAVAFTCKLQAQEENTSTKLSDQYKNGTVPGMKFAPASNAKPVVVAASNENTKESIITQIRKGTAPGMKFAPGTSMSSSTARTIAPATIAKSNANLTSDKPAPAAVKTITPVATPSLPTQETGSVKPAAATVKKVQ
ncbi:MAG: hypothetical protein QM726_11235 [Chitinophagaceae bacterium]